MKIDKNIQKSNFQVKILVETFLRANSKNSMLFTISYLKYSK